MCAGKSGYWAVIFFQQVASIGNNITIQIVAGQSMKVRLFNLCSVSAAHSPVHWQKRAFFGKAAFLLICWFIAFPAGREQNPPCVLDTSKEEFDCRRCTGCSIRSVTPQGPVAFPSRPGLPYLAPPSSSSPSSLTYPASKRSTSSAQHAPSSLPLAAWRSQSTMVSCWNPTTDPPHCKTSNFDERS